MASQSGYGEAQPGSVHAVCYSTISIIDSASHTTVTGELDPPFDQLVSQQLKRAAQQAAAAAASEAAAVGTARPVTTTPHDTDNRHDASGQAADGPKTAAHGTAPG